MLLSSKSQESDRFWGQRQGADAYLTKPFDPVELTAIVHAVATIDRLDDDQVSVAPATSEVTQ